MKLYRKFLRLWLAVSSFAGFLTGWVFLAHSAGPETVTMPDGATIVLDLPPIPSVDDFAAAESDAGSVQSFTFSQPSFPVRMRTGGS